MTEMGIDLKAGKRFRTKRLRIASALSRSLSTFQWSHQWKARTPNGLLGVIFNLSACFTISLGSVAVFHVAVVFCILHSAVSIAFCRRVSLRCVMGSIQIGRAHV